MADAQALIFYSWQSDLPNATNRGFIERALENVVKSVRDDDSLQVDPVIDRDTIGVPGSPDIAGTIFEKIERAQVFVCDISIINEGTTKRPTPNPNVLIELGYALKALGPNRVLMVLNDAFGGPELLPFDLRMRRVIRYHMPTDTSDRAPTRKHLESALAEGVRGTLAGATMPPPGELIEPTLADRTRAAIEAGRPDQAALMRQYMVDFSTRLNVHAPILTNVPQDEWDDLFMQSLAQSLDLVAEFARVSRVVAQMNAADAARALYKGFEHMVDLYTLPNAAASQFTKLDFDFAKFVGHELFVTCFAFLIQEERWELIADLLAQSLYVRPAHFEGRQRAAFTCVSEYVEMLEVRKQRLHSNRMSLHADLLNERHTQGELDNLMPMEQFAEADYFLFLRAELPSETVSSWIEWKPWSGLYLHEMPRYLVDATNARVAEQMLRPLGVGDIATLRSRLAQRALRYGKLWSATGFWHSPLEGFDTNIIGSE